MEIKISAGETVTIIGVDEQGAEYEYWHGGPNHGYANYVKFETFKAALDVLCSEGRRITAIKLYREHTGLGLKESRDWVWNNCSNPVPKKARKCWDCTHRELNEGNSWTPCFFCLRDENVSFPHFLRRDIGQILSDAGFIPKGTFEED